MSHRDIAESACHRITPATDPLKPLTAFLGRAFRDNLLSIDNYRAAVDAMLDVSTGHKHTSASRTFSYTFSDRISPKTGVSDTLRFRFASDTATSAIYTATVTNSIRTPTNMAAHITNMMRNEVYAAFPAYGSAAAVEILCSYDTTEDSPTRGLVIFQHTGASGTRILQLLFSSGSELAPLIKFAKRDRKGSYGYRGDGGFLDGYTIDTVTISEGDQLGTTSFFDDNGTTRGFTTAKFQDGVIVTAALDDLAVTGAKVATGAVTGIKLGEAGQQTSPVSPTAIASGATVTWLVDIGRSGATPQVSAFSTSQGTYTGDLKAVLSADNADGTYDIDVTNTSLSSIPDVWLTAY